MSYSFAVRCESKASAKDAIARKMTEVAALQVCHERDKAQALDAAFAFIDLLPDDPTRDVQVGMSGYLAGTWAGTDVVEVSGASVSVNAGLLTRG